MKVGQLSLRLSIKTTFLNSMTYKILASRKLNYTRHLHQLNFSNEAGGQEKDFAHPTKAHPKKIVCAL